MNKTLIAGVVVASAILAGCNSMSQVPQLTAAPDEGQVIGWRDVYNRSGGYSRLPGVKVFEDTPNKITKGTAFAQRNEITTPEFSPRTTDRYVFETDLSIDNKGKDLYTATIFQVGQGEVGCAAPLQISLHPTFIQFKSGWKKKSTGRCADSIGLHSERLTEKQLEKIFFPVSTAPVATYDFNQDGTVYNFKVELDFDGLGGFSIDLDINGEDVLDSYYTNPTKDYNQPKKYFIKHGVYSLALQDFEMISRNAELRRFSN